MTLILKNGKVVTENDVVQADVMLDDEKIIEIGSELEAGSGVEIIDCSGKYVLPGIIDAHVHFNMPCGPDERTIDDFYSGSVSAACGGVTTVIDYVEPGDEQMPLDAVIERRNEADGVICVDYGLHYVVRKWEEKFNKQLDKVIESGITSFKVFTTYEDSKLSYENIYRLLVWCKEKGALVTVHAEDDLTVNTAVNELRRRGDVQPAFHGKSRPVESEVEAVKHILNLASKANSPVYFVHISSYEAARLILDAQMNGQQVFGETCPHYLILDENVYAKNCEPQLFIMCPPLRKENTLNHMWDALEEGAFSVVATDHCAFSKNQKLRSKTFYETLAGIPGVETLLPLMYSEGVGSGRINVIKLVELLSINPAKLFGLFPRKGVIKTGSDADIVVFNPAKEVVLDGKRLHSKAGYSPFDSIKVKGYPEITILRGKVIYKDGEYCGEKGYGKYIYGNLKHEYQISSYIGDSFSRSASI